MATVSPVPRSTRLEVATASAGPFNLGIRLFAGEALRVYVGTVLRQDYTLDTEFNAGYTDYAAITFTAPVPSGSIITIEPVMAAARGLDYLPTDRSLTGKLNIELAQLWAGLGDVARDLSRKFGVIGSTQPTTFPQPGAYGAISWVGDHLEVVPLTGVEANVFASRPALQAFAALATQPEGTELRAGGLGYVAKAGSNAIADVPGYVPALLAAPQHYGSTAGGVADDTSRFAALQASGLLQWIPNGSYAVPGSLSTHTRPKITLADDALLNGVRLPMLALADNSFKSMPASTMFIENDTTTRDDPSTVFIQRVARVDVGRNVSKALRVAVDALATTTNQKEWAISGEIDVFKTSGSGDFVATSGVANKYGTGGQVFGGHFQAKEWVKFSSPTAVTSILGMEVNIPAIGLDHPTENDGTGLRRVIDVIAATNTGLAGWNTPTGNYGPAEIGVGINIRSESTNGGTFRIGLCVQQPGSASAIDTAILIRTTGPYGLRVTGANDIAQIFSNGSPEYGAIFNGTYGSGTAIRLIGGSYLAMEGTNSIRTAYGITGGVWGFYSAAEERVGFRMDSTPNLRMGGVPVVGLRQTGWTPPTGTASRGAFATSTVSTEQLAQRVKALIDDLTTHGLIGG